MSLLFSDLTPFFPCRDLVELPWAEVTSDEELMAIIDDARSQGALETEDDATQDADAPG